MPIDKDIRRQLAIDIEAAGGIQDFTKGEPHALNNILNKAGREKYYGKSKDPIRKEIRNLVDYWKKFSKEKYIEQVVIPFTLGKNTNSTTTAKSGQSKSKACAQDELIRDEFTVVKTNVEPRPQPPKQPVHPTCDRALPYKMNRLGEHMLVPLPKGLFFVCVWAECNLDNIEFIISDDGYSVVQRTRKPSPTCASDLLQHYDWAQDCDNVVVSSVDDALLEIKRDDPNQWKEVELVTLTKEVIRQFVDNRGRPLGEDVASVGHHTDKNGRKVVTFFLKTVDAHRTSPSKAKFGGLSGMNISGSDDGSIFDEETVEDVRAEMEELRNELSRQHMEQCKHQAEQMEMQRQQMEQQQMQMQQQMQFMQQMMQSFAAQNQANQHPVVPDGAPSSHAFAQAQAEAAANAGLVQPQNY